MRRSKIHIGILFELQKGSAGSIVNLADRVGTFRSSVSRSLHSLEYEGLVHKSDLGWELTELGDEEANRLKNELIILKAKLESKLAYLHEILFN